MKYGFVLPGASPSEQLEQAVLAEASGWDGVFVWESHYGVDAWSMLAAMAARTERVMLGTMLTPLPWRRPWKVASQALTVHELSSGRAIVSVGLGAVDTGLGTTGDETDRRLRAQRLDEALDLITGLWNGTSVYQCEHYRIDLTPFTTNAGWPTEPDHVPIWVVGAWPHPKSMRRALRCDGLIAAGADTPDILGEAIAWLDANGGRAPAFDVVVEGETPADDAAAGAAAVALWAGAGATWWLEARWSAPAGPERQRIVRERLQAGPPRIE